MYKKNKIKFIMQVLEIGFSHFPRLYLIMLLSFSSILIELLSMSLIASISSDKYIFFEDYLSLIDKKILFIIVIFLFIFRFISMFIVETQLVYIARIFQSYLSSDTLKKIFSLPLFEIEKKEIGFFITMAGDEASKAAEILIMVLKIFNFIVLFILYFILLAFFDLNISLIIIILLMLSFFIIKFIMKKSSSLGEVSLKKGRQASSLFLDGLNGLKTIKSFGIEQFILDKYKFVMFDYQVTNYKLLFLSLMNKITPLLFLLFLFTLYIIIDYMNDNRLTVVYLISLFFIIIRFLLNLGELLQVITKVAGDLKYINNIIHFITQVKDIQDITENIKSINLIELKNISFSYDNTSVFSDLNLIFKKQCSYAIIGKTGSGKSTLIDLIMYFLCPTAGQIIFNNLNSRDININSLKNSILYLSQESIIFNDTIKNNLSLNKQYSNEELFRVLEIVDLKDMVDKYEEKLDYLLNYKGTNISGGQKQRLNIARAILRNPDVLILDESVNALDEDTRLKIVKNLLSLYKNKIIIFVTHDKDILSLVDEVIDLDYIKGNK